VEGVFRGMDTNGSGRLSKRELGAGMDRLGYRLLDWELDLLFDRFDRNRDGVVSLPEFLDRVLEVATRDAGGLERGRVEDAQCVCMCVWT
jgi:Ca2+-binding EF-hand superfamily protein